MDISVLGKRTQGALVASSIGDALGWPNEGKSGNQGKYQDSNNRFVSWKRKNKTPYWHVETIKAGEYSDDTQLMLAISRSLLTNDWISHFTQKEYPFWLTYERGAGRAVLKAAALWKKGERPWENENFRRQYFMAGGNGGAMRILPHVIKNISKSIDDVLDEVVEDVIVSHGHPRAILGATCYAYALYYLIKKDNVLSFAELVNTLIDGRKKWGGVPNRNKFSEWLNIAQNSAGYIYSDEWNNCYTSMLKVFNYINVALGEGILSDDKSVLDYIGAFSKASGAGDVAVLSAVYFFSKYVNSPELAISIPANMLGIDTDTIASMTGGLVGAFHGTEWIPLEWKMVQDYSYICDISNNLCEGGTDRAVNATMYETDLFQNMKEVRYEELDSKYSVMRITEYKTSFGQTIYIKTIGKRIEEKQLPNNKETEEKQISNDKISCFSQELAKRIINDELLSRISLRKTTEVIFLKHQGMDENSIIKKTKLAEDVVKRIIDLFFGE